MGGWRGGRVLYTISENIGSLGKKMKAVFGGEKSETNCRKGGGVEFGWSPTHRSRVVLQGA